MLKSTLFKYVYIYFFFLLYNVLFPSGFFKDSSLKMRWCQKFKDYIVVPAGCGRIEIQEGVVHRKVQYLIVHSLHFKVRLNVTSDLVWGWLLEDSGCMTAVLGAVWLESKRGQKDNWNRDHRCFWASDHLWKSPIISIPG